MSEVHQHGHRVYDGHGTIDSSNELLASLLHEALLSTREDAFRAVCDVAIDRGVLPEMLLVLLKRQWRQMPVSRGLTRVDSDAILEGHVTRCIKEYYSARRTGLI